MKLVRMLTAAFLEGGHRAAGEELLVPDDMALEKHMQLVETGEIGDRPAAGGFHVPLYLDHTHVLGIPPSPMPPGVADKVEA